MKNLIGLVTLFGITVGNVYSQVVSSERIVVDTTFPGGYFYFRMDKTRIAPPNDSKKNKGNYDNASIINNFAAEQKSIERQAIENYIDSMRVVMFTSFLGFSKKEADIFWPAYNDYQNKLYKILERRRDVSDKLCNPFGKYKTREYAAFVDIELKSYKEEALLKEQYGEKFKAILGENFYLLYRAEHLFARWMYTHLF
jgi:hypothetical protein